MMLNNYEMAMLLGCLLLLCNTVRNVLYLIKRRCGKKSVHLGLASFWIIALYPFIQCWLDDSLNGRIRKELYVLFFLSNALMNGISAVMEELYVADNRASLKIVEQKTPVAWMSMLGMIQLYYYYFRSYYYYHGNGAVYFTGYAIILIACLLFSCYYYNKKQKDDKT